MKLPVRNRVAEPLPGLTGRVRSERRTKSLLPRLVAGDLALIDHTDLDRDTAQALLDRGVVAVLNARPFISGRYPNLGPEVLAAAGVVLVDELGDDGFRAVKDGGRLRLDEGTLYDGETEVATGRALTAADVTRQMDTARSGLAAQLESLTHNSTEFLRREEDLLLHGAGAPRPATRIEGRPVVVVSPSHDHRTELRGIQRYLKEQRPVLIGVDAAADSLLASGHRPDIVIVTAADVEEADAVSAKAVKAARDVVVLSARDGATAALSRIDRLGITPHRFGTSATAEDAALLLADAGEASVIVGVGMHATLEEFLDSARGGLPSTFLTRLKVGPRLVDARSVPTLYSGAVRGSHVLLTLLAGLVALAVAVGVTPVGQEWVGDLTHVIEGLLK